MQIRFHLNIVLTFELTQFVQVAIVHDDGLPDILPGATRPAAQW